MKYNQINVLIQIKSFLNMEWSPYQVNDILNSFPEKKAKLERYIKPESNNN